MSSSSLSSSTSHTANPPEATTIPPLSVAALLDEHAAAPDPPQAALDQAVAERVGLHAKNEQLWRLIERQRAGYSQLLQELERARAERDAYKERLKMTVRSLSPDPRRRAAEGSPAPQSKSRWRSHSQDTRASPQPLPHAAGADSHLQPRRA
ncbi:hypothetical protein GGX14DRAFT_468435 [Mycena pura]|uniref:Uncharacterized protein n=1 Tax=Mycena pura TaxID=153505 RepID=A0AAD6V051_9AGAR|nr:hypothetical protein GGX14DRAFT_468435 [Mycena pura]